MREVGSNLPSAGPRKFPFSGLRLLRVQSAGSRAAWHPCRIYRRPAKVMFHCTVRACQLLSALRRTGCGALARAVPACECFAHEARVVERSCARRRREGTLATRKVAEQHFGLGCKFARHNCLRREQNCAASLGTGFRKVDVVHVLCSQAARAPGCTPGVSAMQPQPK